MKPRILDLIFALILALLLGSTMAAGAGVIYQTGFEPPTFSVGTLNGQDDWLSSGASATQTVVETSVFKSGLRAVGITPSGANGVVVGATRRASYNASNQILTLSIDAFLSATGTPNFWTVIHADITPCYSQPNIDVNVDGKGQIHVFVLGTDHPGGVHITRGVWNHYELDLNFTNYTVSAFYNAIPIVQNVSFSSPGATLSDYSFYAQPSAATDHGYFDNFSVSASGAPIVSTVHGAETNAVPRVGLLREFGRFTFKGADSFSPWALWLGLNSTFDFPEQSHPLAPRDKFLAATANLLRLGYEHCGFPDARVVASYDPKKDRVVVRIKEGHRYLCGPVEVIGAHKIPVQPIVEALSVTNSPNGPFPQPYQFDDNAPANRADAGDSATQDFLWAAGQPAHFDHVSLHYLASVVSNSLAQHGFLMPRFELKVVPLAKTQTAALQVKILDEGPSATIGHIEVAGNERNSREVLLNYVNLKPGMEFTSTLAATINDLLYHSARFLTNWVSVGQPDSAGKVALTINVFENDQCPPLDREFSPTEQTLLKARDWLAKAGEGAEDAVLTFSGYPDDATTLQFIFSPRQGLFVQERDVVSDTNQICHALIMSPSQFALYDPELRQKFVAAHPHKHFIFYLAAETGSPKENGDCSSLTCGAALTEPENPTSAPPFAFTMSLAPAGFVRIAHNTNSVCWMNGSQFVCSNADGALRLDARTGRIIELTARSGGPHSAQWDLRFQPDAFMPALERVEHDGADYENVYDTNSPLGSAVVFFGSELAQSRLVEPFLHARLPGSTCTQLPGLLRKLDTGDVFSVFNSLKDLDTPPAGPAGEFQIPEEPQPYTAGTFDEFLYKVNQGIFAVGDEILPVNSWPWTLMRDGSFLVSHKQAGYLLPDLVGIYNSKDCGPIGCLATASLLKDLKSPLAKTMAARGLQRLSTDDFERDCRLFLDPKTFCGQFAAGLAGTLRNLDDQELNALVAPMPPARGEFIGDCARNLREARQGQPLFETISPVLNDYWEKELKQNTAGSLKKIANE